MIRKKMSFGGMEFYLVSPQTEKEALICISTLSKEDSCETLGLDIETGKKGTFAESGLNPHNSFVRLIQIYNDKLNEVHVFDTFLLGKDAQKALADFIASRQFIAHNAIFELKHLNFLMPKTLTNVHCSMLMGIMVDRAERSPFEMEDEEDEESGISQYRRRGGYSLANMCARYLKLEVDKELQVSDWNSKSLTNEQLGYAALDALLTKNLGTIFFEKIKKYKMLRAYKMLKDTQHVIARMENTGFYIDVDAHKKLIAEWEEKEKNTLKACKPYFNDVNLNSSAQLNNWVKKYFAGKPSILNSWPVTAKSLDDSKVYSFSKTALAGLCSLKEIAALLEYKQTTKLISTYGTTLLEKINPFTRRIHSSFILGETRTGRLSSRAPNLQNIPRGADIKKSFCAEEGRILVAADFSQIEMRVAAELSRDPVMLDAFRKGVDLHKYIVSALTGKPLNKVTKEERQLGKAINFGLLFGMGPTKLRIYAKTSYGVDLTEEQAYAAWNTFHKHYSKYSAWCTVQRNMCSKLGFVRTPLGKIRKITEEEVFTKAINTPVQGGAAEVCFASLMNLHKCFETDEIAKIVNVIHDEIILEVVEGFEKEAGNTLQKCMTDGLLFVFPTAITTGLVEVKYGKSWADTKN